MGRRRRARRAPGLIPSIGKAIWSGLRHGFLHPTRLIALAVVVVCAIGLWRLMTHSEAFRITTIRTTPQSTLAIPNSLIGQQLWAVNVHALARTLKSQQPELKQVRVTRILPNTLHIEVIERTPMAQIRSFRSSGLRQWFPVDAEGYILSQASHAPWQDLVKLQGVQTPRSAADVLQVGGENTSPRLLRALRLTEYLLRVPALADHRVTAVDVGDGSQLSFMLDEAIEIRCGTEAELEDHLTRLQEVLRRVAEQQLAVRYIDVRFAEPVIGPKT